MTSARTGPGCSACGDHRHDDCEDRRVPFDTERALAVAIFGENVTACCCEGPTSPMQLWWQAREEFGDDMRARTKRYNALMIEHGHATH